LDDVGGYRLVAGAFPLGVLAALRAIYLDDFDNDTGQGPEGGRPWG
jgi:hypothetical protein